MYKTVTALCIAAAITQTAYALPADINIEPAAGSTVEKIEVIKIKSGFLEKRYNIDTADITINGRSYTADLETPDYETLVCTLRTPITAVGSYLIVVPENTFLMGWDGTPNPVIEFSYTVQNDLGGGETGGDDRIQNTVPRGYTFSPAAGTEVPVLTSFSVTAANDMFLSPSSRCQNITINGQHVETLTDISGDLGNTITWKLAEPINVPGNYTIYIPAGEFFGIDETDNELFMVTVIVTGGDLPEPDYYPGEITSDPINGSTVNQLSRIAVMSPKLTSAYVGTQSEGVTIARDGNIMNVSYTLTPDEDDFNEAHVVWMEITPAITEVGHYTISFPARCFEIAKYPNNWYTAPFTLDFTIAKSDGITEVSSDTEARYFTLDGLEIDRPQHPGIYLRHTPAKTEKIIIR